MQKTAIIAIFGFFFALTNDTKAANYLSFDQEGQLTGISVRSGYGSQRMGFDFNGSLRIGHDCQGYQSPELPPDYRPELRSAAAVGVKATYTLVCSVGSPLAGQRAVSRVRNEEDGPWMRVYTVHQAEKTLIMGAPD